MDKRHHENRSNFSYWREQCGMKGEDQLERAYWEEMDRERHGLNDLPAGSHRPVSDEREAA